MKDLIRKILKEDKLERFMNYVADGINDLKLRSVSDAMDTFGLYDDMIPEFKRRAFDKLQRLEDTPFDTNDYYDGEFGTYSFKFEIGNVRDFLDMYDGEIQFDVQFLNEGHLEVDGVDYTLEEGSNHEDFGWEVDFEIGDVVKGVLRTEVPELIFVTDISIRNWYFYEG